MEEEKIVTNTERLIIKKRTKRKITPDKVFSICSINCLSEVYKNCGGKAAILYFTLVGNSNVVGTKEAFKLLKSFLEASGLNKCDLSKATTKLERSGYITVARKPGHKNLYNLTEKGCRGIVDRR